MDLDGLMMHACYRVCLSCVFHLWGNRVGGDDCTFSFFLFFSINLVLILLTTPQSDMMSIRHSSYQRTTNLKIHNTYLGKFTLLGKLARRKENFLSFPFLPFLFIPRYRVRRVQVNRKLTSRMHNYLPESHFKKLMQLIRGCCLPDTVYVL